MKGWLIRFKPTGGKHFINCAIVFRTMERAVEYADLHHSTYDWFLKPYDDGESMEEEE